MKGKTEIKLTLGHISRCSATSCTNRTFNSTVLVVSLQRLLTNSYLVWKSSLEALTSEICKLIFLWNFSDDAVGFYYYYYYYYFYYDSDFIFYEKWSWIHFLFSHHIISLVERNLFFLFFCILFYLSCSLIRVAMNLKALEFFMWIEAKIDGLSAWNYNESYNNQILHNVAFYYNSYS